ncbi:MAG: hypothetical protein ACREQI_01480 [Candidatus Binataceae bacterium]
MERWRIGGGALLAAVLALAMAGCFLGGAERPPPTSIQTPKYYPFQVKGYQGSYPQRKLMVLIPTRATDLAEPGSAPTALLRGAPEIGVVLSQSGKIVQRLYGDPLEPIVQKAIVDSANEAGLTAAAANTADHRPGAVAPADYVLASKITRCWVKKRREPGSAEGPLWQTQAEFALDIWVYKPPFSVPFWKGTSDNIYFDPPVGSFGLGSADEAGIYEEPGQDLSVALTRAVAGIFQQRELHDLMLEDRLRSR